MHPGSGINKPVAVRDWLNKAQPKEDYILVIDSDTVMRVPFSMEELHLEPGQLWDAHGLQGAKSSKNRHPVMA